MLIIGLTGSIGMGKSTAAKRLKEHNIPVLDTDKVVHDLYAGDAAVQIEHAFPGTVFNGTVDRKILSQKVLGKPDELKKLEGIIHPLVRREEVKFLEENLINGHNVVVLEVPLLFETGMDELVDLTIVVHAPENIRDERVLQRPGMTRKKLKSIVSRQLPDKEKIAKADYVVDTSGDIEKSWRQIDNIIESLGEKTPAAIGLWDISVEHPYSN